MGQDNYIAPVYVSDGDEYPGTDWNQFQIDNMKHMRFLSTQYSSEVALGTKSTDFSVNFGDGNRQAVTLDGNADITLLTSDLTCGNHTLRIIQDGTGDRFWTFDSDAVEFTNKGTAPTPSSDANAEDICGLYYSGTKFYLVPSLDFG